MDNERSISDSSAEIEPAQGKNISILSRKILACAHRGFSGNVFFKSILQLLRDALECDAVELRLIETGKLQYCEVNLSADEDFVLKMLPPRKNRDGELIPSPGDGSDRERLYRAVIERRFDPSATNYSAYGSFWTGDTATPIKIIDEHSSVKAVSELRLDSEFPAIAVIPFSFENENRGLMIVKSRRKDFFSRVGVESFEEIAQIIGIATAHWRAQIALRDRIKELTCLCGMAKIAGRPEVSLPDILRETVELLPGAWRFPDIAVARIICDGIAYSTTGFRAGLQSLGADIIVNGKKRGLVEVAYVQKVRESDEGPFFKEERSLIAAMADEVALIIQRREAEEQKEKLEEQLRHADRLATIGQLAAGVAHELNEPLANILGFAQLASRSGDILEPLAKDLNKIIAAALHARTVIERLNLFARQSPQKKGMVDINRVISDGLYFLESRCAKAGITMIKNLNPHLPEIYADQGQVYQVLVNLVVNAIQAMPRGGVLTIKTAGYEKHVGFSVEDNGIGMSEDIRKKIFVPFFTTKDVNEGTGLGLAVVHGIVSAHGGTISVKSMAGKGSCFEVRLPLQIREPE